MFGQVNLEKLCSKIMKKNFALALFSPLGPWTGNDFLFKGGLIIYNLSRQNLPYLCLKNSFFENLRKKDYENIFRNGRVNLIL